VKAPHKTGPGGWGVHHHKPGKPSPPPPHHKAKPPHHKQPKKPKPAPKPQKTHAHKKPRKFSPGWDVACCAAEALGVLLGWGWDEVLALYWRTASDPDSGATILDTLAAAPARCRLQTRPHAYAQRLLGPPRTGAGLILGVTLPEPHAIAVTPDGTWWSWGHPLNPHDWPQLVIEEAWCLR
jgi:hypothetical protein